MSTYDEGYVIEVTIGSDSELKLSTLAIVGVPMLGSPQHATSPWGRQAKLGACPCGQDALRPPRALGLVEDCQLVRAAIDCPDIS